MQTLTEPKKQEISQGVLKLSSILKKRVRAKPKITLQKGFYKWLVLAKPRKTKSIVEKFYFNSKLNPIKALWLFRTMFARDAEKNRIDAKLVVFLESVIKVFEFLRIKRLRQPFSRISVKEDSLVKKFRYVVEICKRQESFRLREFVANFKGKFKTKRVIDGVLLLQKFKDKIMTASFSNIVEKTRFEFQQKTKFLSFLTNKILQANRLKKAQVFKVLIKLVGRIKLFEGLLNRLSAIIKNRQNRSKKDTITALVIFSNVKAKIIAGKDAAFNIAFKRIDQVFQRANQRTLGQASGFLKQQFLVKFERIKDILKIIRRNYGIKSTSALNLLRVFAKNRSHNKKLPFLKALDSLAKKSQKYTFDKIRQKSENKLFESYYHMLQSTKIVAENNSLSKSGRKIANPQDIDIRNFCSFFERLFKEKIFRSKILIFNKLKLSLKKRKILFHKTRDEQVIKNTIIMSNLIKALFKKQFLTKFLGFKIWAQYTEFLRKYSIKGDQARLFFEILAQKEISSSTDLPDSMTPKINVVRFNAIIKKMILSRKLAFYNNLKLVLLNKEFELYTGFAFLIRNIFNRRMSNYFGRINSRNVVYVKRDEVDGGFSNGKSILSKSFRSKFSGYKTPKK